MSREIKVTCVALLLGALAFLPNAGRAGTAPALEASTAAAALTVAAAVALASRRRQKRKGP